MAVFKGLIKSCEVCSTEFKVPRSQAHVRTCSKECGYKIRRVANKKDKVQLTCAHCSKLFLEHPSHADRRRYCSKECMFDAPETLAERSKRISGESNPSWKGGVGIKAVSSSGKAYTRRPPEVEQEKAVRRKRAKASATPSWANIELIREIYRLCQEITSETGLQHHVDHLVPLKSDFVCGLHVEHNLRIVPATENLRKHNRTWPDM